MKEQLERQLGHVEAQLAAQKKVSFMLTVNLLYCFQRLKLFLSLSTDQESETRLDELNYMMEERLAGLQRGLTDQIDGVTGWKIV